MEQRLDAFAGAVTAHDWQRAHEQHMAFHVGVFQALRTPALELLLRPVQQYIFLTSVPPVPDDPSVWEVETHPPILAALRAGDEHAVRTAMREHFQFVAKPEYVMLAELLGSPQHSNPWGYLAHPWARKMRTRASPALSLNPVNPRCREM